MKKVVLGVMLLMVAISVRPEIGQTADVKIALLNSANTSTYFPARYQTGHCDSGGNMLGEREYERYFRGWKYVLDGNQFKPLDLDGSAYNYDIIFDDDITDPAKLNTSNYQILILSNTAILTDDQSRAIQQWVLKGGRLIATYGSGYKNIIPDDKALKDGLKPQSGGTFGIHQLWHDPVSRSFGTDERFLGDPNRPSVHVRITKSFGPTDPWEISDDLAYGADANLLTPRPELFRDALAFLTFDYTPPPPSDAVMTLEKKMYPAILLTKMSKGQVVYFSFAPEFIVALEFDLAGHCVNDGNYNSPDDNPNLGICQNLPGPPDIASPCAANPLTVPRENMFEGRSSALLPLMKNTLDYMCDGDCTP